MNFFTGSFQEQWPNGFLENSLYVLLGSTTDGKGVLREYQDNGYLCKPTRSLLSRIVIKNEKDYAFKDVSIINDPRQLDTFKIDGDNLKRLANQIVELFPGESSLTYYTPFRSTNKERTNASGAVYDHKHYTKRVLRKKKLIKQKTAELNEVILEEQDDDEINLEWLSRNLEPVNEVREKWISTYNARLALLKEDNLPIHEYYMKFPILFTRIGLELLLSDYNQLLPHTERNFINNWPAIRQHLIKRLMNCNKIKNVSDKALVHLLPTLLSYNRDAVIFYLLPYLIDQPYRKRKRNTDNEENNQSRNIPIEERRESFFLHVPTAGDVLPSLLALRDKLRLANLTLQPIPFLLGP